MHLLLHEEEQLHLQALEREAKELFQQLRDSQDVGNVSARADLAQMQKPQPVYPELTSWRITGVLEMLNNFRAGMVLLAGTWTLDSRALCMLSPPLGAQV
ncbi:hypothetical protein H8959_002778 [Pygathrix nigripes]